jgi:hypothetical protein
LNEYEKSLFLTKAEKEIVKNYFTANSKGNNLQQGFDDSAKRQADFSVLMKTGACSALSESGGTSYIYGYKFTPTGEASVDIDTGSISFTKNGKPYGPVPADTYEVAADGTISVGTSDPDIVLVEVDSVALGAGSLVVTTVSVGAVMKIDDRSNLYSFPNDVFIVVNETAKTNTGIKQVMPLKFDEYMRLMSKPYKRPLKNQVWRLINSGTVSKSAATKIVEIITGASESISSYSVRYVRVPKPIIVGNLDGLSIDGQTAISTECELDPMLHEDVLQRAVELAKVAWTATGQDNVQAEMAAGQRSE